MQNKIEIVKTDEQGGLEFYYINLSVNENLFRQLVDMYHLTAQREAKAQGLNYLTYSNSEGKSLTWKADSIKIKGLNPYIVINDLRLLEDTDRSSFPNNEEDAKKELEIYGIETVLADNTKVNPSKTESEE